MSSANSSSYHKLSSTNIDESSIKWYVDTKNNYNNDNIDWFFRIIEKYGTSILRVDTYIKHREVICKKYPKHDLIPKDKCYIVKIF